MDAPKIERFDRAKHDRALFSCGKAPLDDFLHSLVTQYEKRGLGKTYVLVPSDSGRVFGYYTLASSAIAAEHLPAKLAKKLPKHPIPTVLLARLAVDQSMHGKGFGADLLLDALARVDELSGALGIHAMEVDAIDEQAQAYYQRFGFDLLADRPLHLVLPVSTFGQVFPRKK